MENSSVDNVNISNIKMTKEFNHNPQTKTNVGDGGLDTHSECSSLNKDKTEDKEPEVVHISSQRTSGSEFNLNEELKDYGRDELIEEIARLRIVLVKGNSKAYQKAKKIFLNEKKELEEKIQNARRRLHIFLCSKIEGEILLPKKDIKKIYNEVDKIFKEEFGEKLTK